MPQLAYRLETLKGTAETPTLLLDHIIDLTETVFFNLLVALCAIDEPFCLELLQQILKIVRAAIPLPSPDFHKDPEDIREWIKMWLTWTISHARDGTPSLVFGGKC